MKTMSATVNIPGPVIAVTFERHRFCNVACSETSNGGKQFYWYISFDRVNKHDGYFTKCLEQNQTKLCTRMYFFGVQLFSRTFRKFPQNTACPL